MKIFKQMESEVRSYSRSFSCVFDKAQGEVLFDIDGREYLDFLAGAGTLNYGHNNPVLKKALIEYIERDGITHGLDMHTEAKSDFLKAMRDKIFAPRGMDYRIQFTGPTGTNAIEAALKLARKVTGRQTIVSFTNGFHGVSLGALAATGNSHHRGGAGMLLTGVTRMPYDGYLGAAVDTTEYLDKALSDGSSGVDKPAAVVVETVQGEGGLNVASHEWLRALEKVCRRHDILLIVDDIQAGCGRTGTFFSFEQAGIKPDMVTLSKSLSGYGLPMAVVLIRPELDEWEPGEHNGTFRGNNVAFQTATAAINHYWSDDSFSREIARKSRVVSTRLDKMATKYGHGRFSTKGMGMFQGIDCGTGEMAGAISLRAFEKGVIIETCGSDDHVLKFFCPLTISDESLKRGLDIVEASMREICQERAAKPVKDGDLETAAASNE
jgi:diaminobutyrate-2-oxoglutarate transaminase